MPMFPELDSMTTVPGRMAPLSIPCLMMLAAERSFVLPPGFRHSNFAYRWKSMSLKMRLSLISGVLPTTDNTPSFTGCLPYSQCCGLKIARFDGFAPEEQNAYRCRLPDLPLREERNVGLSDQSTLRSPGAQGIIACLPRGSFQVGPGAHSSDRRQSGRQDLRQYSALLPPTSDVQKTYVTISPR